MSYQIITDATSDLSRDLVRDVPEIAVIPMEITVNGEAESILEAEGPSVTAFYEKLRGGADVKTSQINTEVYKEHFRKYLDEGQDILYLCFTSGLSGTINSAHIAIDELAEDYPDRTIICADTLAASIGEERVTIEDVYEPYLIQAGFLHRTQKGRVVSRLAYQHLGLEFDSEEEEQITISISE